MGVSPRPERRHARTLGSTAGQEAALTAATPPARYGDRSSDAAGWGGDCVRGVAGAQPQHTADTAHLRQLHLELLLQKPDLLLKSLLQLRAQPPTRCDARRPMPEVASAVPCPPFALQRRPERRARTRPRRRPTSRRAASAPRKAPPRSDIGTGPSAARAVEAATPGACVRHCELAHARATERDGVRCDRRDLCVGRCAPS